MIETGLFVFQPVPMETLQWLPVYSQEVFEQLPPWLNRPEYQLAELGGRLHIFIPQARQTMVVQPFDFVMQAPDGLPMVIRKSAFERFAALVPRNPKNLLDETQPVESFVIRSGLSEVTPPAQNNV